MADPAPPPRYGPKGAGHRVLAFLADGAGSREDIYLATLSRNAQGEKRVGFILQQLASDGFIQRVERGFYEITQRGAEALAILNAGESAYGSAPTCAGGRARQPRAAPSVRIFAKQSEAA